MSATDKQLWILAGGNGAGKSTFYNIWLKDKGVEFVNADLIEKKLDFVTEDEPSYQAARIARKRFRENIEMGRSFCFETVFSHVSKLEMLKEAQQLGYVVNLVFIHLSHPDLNQLRVKQRVCTGGHPVPGEKIASRIPRTLALVKLAIQVADCSLLYDNSSHDNPYLPIAKKSGTEVTIYSEPLPAWAAEALSLNVS